jgi:hypothetical protein
VNRILFRYIFPIFTILLIPVGLTAELPGLSSGNAEKEDKELAGRGVKFPIRLVVGGGEGQGGFIAPEFIGVDSEGNLYIAETHGATIGKWSPDGRILWEIDGREWGGDGFLAPGSIGVSSSLNLYLLDVGRREIFRLSDRGEILGIVQAGDLSDPRAIALTRTGKLVVYDGSTTKISVIAPTGSVLWSFRPEGFRSRKQVGMTVVDEEELCLYTRGANSLRIYHFMGGLKRIWKPTLPGGKGVRISSVDFDKDGRAIILDSDLPGLFVFDGLGNLLFDISDSLEEIGFKGPGDVRKWGDTIYVADVRGGRVFKIEIPSGTI